MSGRTRHRLAPSRPRAWRESKAVEGLMLCGARFDQFDPTVLVAAPDTDADPRDGLEEGDRICRVCEARAAAMRLGVEFAVCHACDGAGEWRRPYYHVPDGQNLSTDAEYYMRQWDRCETCDGQRLLIVSMRWFHSDPDGSSHTTVDSTPAYRD